MCVNTVSDRPDPRDSVRVVKGQEMGEVNEEVGSAMQLIELLSPEQKVPMAAAIQEKPVLGGFDFLSFFHLNTNPFSDSVNPEFFYKMDVHEVAHIRMMLAIEHDISLGLVTAISGMGKTLISQILLKNMDPAKYQAVLVLVSPNMSKTALLKEILSELNIPLPEDKVTTQELLNLLQNFIIDLHDKGKKLVILIDECHFLSAESLHMVRSISNIEIPEKKLSTCILFGEQRFLKRLEHPSYESLRNRMYLRSELPPLDAKTTGQYIKFRLMVSGREAPLFDDASFGAIHKASNGICRQINKICMLALLEAFARRKPVIDKEMIDAATRLV